MKPLNRDLVYDFVQTEIADFHNRRLASLERVKLRDMLKKKNPYLFRAKNITIAADLIASMLDARLSSTEEQIFGGFLEELVLHVVGQTCDGRKSSARGVDVEFEKDSAWHIVSVKSGHNWGNSAQYRSLENDFKQALIVQRQAHNNMQVRAMLGMCYGKSRTKDTGLYIKIMGQSFWHFISGDERLYIDIIEPIGFKARQHNEDFAERRDALQNRMMREFIDEFCFADGRIDWESLVQFNSGNYTGEMP